MIGMMDWPEWSDRYFTPDAAARLVEHGAGQPRIRSRGVFPTEFFNRIDAVATT
jgi:hypothetical protein